MLSGANFFMLVGLPSLCLSVILSIVAYQIQNWYICKYKKSDYVRLMHKTHDATHVKKIGRK